MKRGTTIRVISEAGQALERGLITRHYRLAHREASCLGCGLCADVCPLGAIRQQAGAVEGGRLLRRPRPELLAEKCNFCGECVVVCPSHSLALTVDGVPHLMAVAGGAFPTLRAAIAADVSRCRTDCGLACRAACPVEAVSVQVEGSEEKPESIVAVAFDEGKCFYCGKCDAACPADAIATARPYGGRVELNESLCPTGCQVCVDACPSQAIALRADSQAGARLSVDERGCFYCGACARACPAPGALAVKRAQVRHTEIKSAAWTAALAKILSPELQARELEARARRRTKEAALGLLRLKK